MTDTEILAHLDQLYDPVFDAPVSRWGTWSEKWEDVPKSYRHDAIVLSVADMEFTTAPVVKQAVVRAAEHGIYGYTRLDNHYKKSAAQWFHTRHNWRVDSDDIVFFPKVIEFFSAYINHISPGEVVAVVRPSYSPIIKILQAGGAQIIDVELIKESDSYRIDWQAMEEAFTKADSLLWYSPHNPTGRVWTQDELQCLADLARQYHIRILSDDIHADIVRHQQYAQSAICEAVQVDRSLGANDTGIKSWQHTDTQAAPTYIPLSVIAPDLYASGQIIIVYSPGKTFNMAGIESATVFVGNKTLRDAIKASTRKIGFLNPSYFTLPAVCAAYDHGASWVDTIRTIIDRNLAYAFARIRDEAPQLMTYIPEGTYLMWIKVNDDIAFDVEDMMEKTHVIVSPGPNFGAKYSHYFRINIACPLPVLQTALHRIVTYFNSDAITDR